MMIAAGTKAKSDKSGEEDLIGLIEQEYRHAIEVLNRVTKDWVDTWRASCDKFQEMEEKRIKYIHDSLWA